MQRITPDRDWPLFDAAATRAIERAAASSLPPHTLMQRAGLAVARLATAIAPHARTIWIACGPGNNGGDGLEAAMHLRQWGKQAVVTWLGAAGSAPADALASLHRAREAGVAFEAQPPGRFELAIDAMFGLGHSRPLEGPAAQWSAAMDSGCTPVLAVDIPSGLSGDTGSGKAVRADHTLGLLTLKPGLFTANGRDAAGQVWLDDLGVAAETSKCIASLAGPSIKRARLHATHKGSYGDVAVIGGAPGMAGAALLAASAALHGGAGRVFAGLLDSAMPTVDPMLPELMIRPWDSLDLGAMTVACGCGGGDAIRAVLPKVLSTARTLVLDADALNAIAADTQLQPLLQARSRRSRATVLTPHPLEAARLLGCGVAQVQADRLAASRELAHRFACVVVLKGSGSIVAARGWTQLINPTGNARLATAGTGDVLAGFIAARIAVSAEVFVATAAAVYEHGLAADRWPARQALTASSLARALTGAS
jgi:ADP-dependent NAD(P)H-hydrate dehydratase / NAD(P)H-hydrate epimerase